MRKEKHIASGREYTLIVEENGLGGRVIPTFEGKPVGVTYSVSIEVAQNFKSQPGANALQELLKIAKNDLDRGIVKSQQEGL